MKLPECFGVAIAEAMDFAQAAHHPGGASRLSLLLGVDSGKSQRFDDGAKRHRHKPRRARREFPQVDSVKPVAGGLWFHPEFSKNYLRLCLDPRPQASDALSLILKPRHHTIDASVGPYALIETLGSGAMGVVHRARHHISGRIIALKTPRTSSPWALEAIRREVQTLRRVSHPGVVRLVEHGVHDGRPWYAMELLDGETLRKFKERLWQAHYLPLAPLESAVTRTETESVNSLDELAEPALERGMRRGGPRGLPPAAAGQLERVINLVRHLCGTLSFLHTEGFVSCDLKPENLVLVRGDPVIIDFGLATHQPGGSSREAMLGQQGAVGTLPYMSPEQIRGELLDARSDLYSLGCLLYELVTGRPPFVSGPKSIPRQHLEDPVCPASELVTGVAPILDAVLIRLLSKEPSQRYGYADEVAAALDSVVGQAVSGHTPRTLPAYLCRPRFIDRLGLLETMASARRDAARGRGGLILLGGESGVGKTRLALELAQLARRERMKVVTSEAALLSLEGTDRVAPAPLHALRPLFETIADRCLEGPAMTARLLGHRRALLSTYEPLLEHVPSQDEPAPIAHLPTEASRQRLFKYLAETLSALASLEPLLLIVDDAGWADELSLAFLRSLSAEFLARTPVLILCAYRNDDASDPLRKLTEHPAAQNLILPRLDRGALGAMVADMLAMPEPPPQFVEFLAEHAEGNPFFLAEYLRAAVSRRVLYRDENHMWRVAGPLSVELGDVEVPLPRSIRSLMQHRFGQLSDRARELAIAGAVLGREFELQVLAEVARLEPEAQGKTRLDELLERQVLEHSIGDRLRFVHDKLREFAYAQATPSQLQDLHLRAAVCMEGRPDANQFWSTLGHHFALARLPKQAARYFTQAAEQARQAHANADAMAHYRKALRELGTEGDVTARAGLYEALGDVLMLGGQRVGARAEYEAALELLRCTASLNEARLYRKLGKTWETVHPHDEALRLYRVAREKLAQAAGVDTAEHRDESVQLCTDQVFANYWLGYVVEIERLVAELESMLAKHSTPWQRARLHRAQLHLCFRRDRFVLDRQGVEYARAALNECLACGDLGDLPLAHFNFAFALFLHGEYEAADWEMRTALGIAERTGDITSSARCLTYLTINARLRGLPEDVAQYLPRARAVADATSMREYYGVVCAHEAWLEWRAGNEMRAVALADEALHAWEPLAFRYAFQWTARWVLLHAHLVAGELELANVDAVALIDVTQQRLPSRISEQLLASADAWNTGDVLRQSEHLQRALSLAQEYYFL